MDVVGLVGGGGVGIVDVVDVDIQRMYLLKMWLLIYIVVGVVVDTFWCLLFSNF